MVYTVCCDATGCYWQASTEDPSQLGLWVAEHSEHSYFSVYVEKS